MNPFFVISIVYFVISFMMMIKIHLLDTKDLINILKTTKGSRHILETYSLLLIFLLLTGPILLVIEMRDTYHEFRLALIKRKHQK